MEKAIYNSKRFLSDLDLNCLEKPSSTGEHNSENFIYFMFKYENKLLCIEFYDDGEIVLMKSENKYNEAKSIKEYNFLEIKEYLQLK